jgi:hypothetical protein
MSFADFFAVSLINPLSQSRHIGNQKAHAAKDVGHDNQRDDVIALLAE